MLGKTLLPIPATIAALALAWSLPCTIGAAFSEDAQPPASNAQPVPPPATTPQPPAAVTILNNHEAEGILGREVVSTADENMGHIVDVIVDRSGQVRAAIIDFGGFLGVGSRKIAVDWNALHFPPPAKPDAKITLELTRDQVKAAPEYQDGKPIVVLGALGKLEPLAE
jgi:PRC-barrel domain